MFKKTKNKVGFKFDVKYNPNSEEIDFTLEINLEQENECDYENQVDYDRLSLFEESLSQSPESLKKELSHCHKCSLIYIQ